MVSLLTGKWVTIWKLDGTFLLTSLDTTILCLSSEISKISGFITCIGLEVARCAFVVRFLLTLKSSYVAPNSSSLGVFLSSRVEETQEILNNVTMLVPALFEVSDPGIFPDKTTSPNTVLGKTIPYNCLGNDLLARIFQRWSLATRISVWHSSLLVFKNRGSANVATLAIFLAKEAAPARTNLLIFLMTTASKIMGYLPVFPRVTCTTLYSKALGDLSLKPWRAMRSVAITGNCIASTISLVMTLLWAPLSSIKATCLSWIGRCLDCLLRAVRTQVSNAVQRLFFPEEDMEYVAVTGSWGSQLDCTEVVLDTNWPTEFCDVAELTRELHKSLAWGSLMLQLLDEHSPLMTQLELLWKYRHLEHLPSAHLPVALSIFRTDFLAWPVGYLVQSECLCSFLQNIHLRTLLLPKLPLPLLE